MRREMYHRVLLRAIEILGTPEALCAHLRVSQARLDGWLLGNESPPDGMFLKLVDLLSDQDVRKTEQRG